MRQIALALTMLVLPALALTAAAENPNVPRGALGALNPAALQKQMMAKFDLNGNGQLDDSEKAAAAAQMQKFVAAIDKNGNGKIDPEEAAMAKALMSRPGQGGSPQVGANGAAGFAVAGAGGGGGAFADAKAIGNAFGAGAAEGADRAEAIAGGGFGGQIPPDVLKKFDKDKDGQLNEQEQKAAAEALGPKKSRKQRLQEKLDRNGDGKITKEEREAVAAEYQAEQEALKEKKKAELEASRAKSKTKPATAEE